MNSKTLRFIKRTSIILSGVICAFGLLLIFYPQFAAEAIAKTVGGLLIIMGILRVLGYFSGDIYRLAFQHDLAVGLMVIILGALLLARPGSMLNMLCFSIGTAILVDALLKLQTAMDARKFGLKSWWLILLLSILTVVFGAFLLFRPGAEEKLMILFGVSLLAEGILNIATITASVKILEDTPHFDDED